MALIKNRALIEDQWQRVADDQPIPSAGDILVSLKRWSQDRAALTSRNGKLGVILGPADEPESIAADAEQFELIAVEFPKFSDGRGFTTGRLLRERFGFKGELRAIGEVLRDQLFYMWRCGFDAFELKAGKDAKGALDAFNEFHVTYQGAADDPRPLFRRRERGHRAHT